VGINASFEGWTHYRFGRMNDVFGHVFKFIKALGSIHDFLGL
jgi:hypothetical protein